VDYITGGSCGVPPYDWITEKIAPEFGYKIGDDKAPLIEYSAYFDPSRNKHEFGVQWGFMTDQEGAFYWFCFIFSLWLISKLQFINNLNTNYVIIVWVSALALMASLLLFSLSWLPCIF